MLVSVSSKDHSFLSRRAWDSFIGRCRNRGEKILSVMRSECIFFFFLNDESRCISPTPGLVIITLVGTVAE